MGRIRNLSTSTVLYPLEQARRDIGLMLNGDSRWSLQDIHGFGADVSLDFHVTVAVVGLWLRRGA